MAGVICSCDVGLSNTGLPSCQPIAKVAKKLLLTQYFDSTGAINFIDPTATLNKAYFDALINQSDASKRLYPLPLVDNVEDVRGDATFQTLNSGRNLKTQEGVRSFSGLLVKQSPEFLKQLNNVGCNEIGFYIIDKDGNIIGNGEVDGELRPIRVDQNTWNPVLVKATDTEVQSVQISFEWYELEADACIKMITAEGVNSDVNLLTLNGLIDVYGANVTGLSTTGFTIDLNTLYGSMKNPVAIKGWVLADFELYNETTTSLITITSVTESPDGTYTFVIPSQTSSDELELRKDASKLGYDDAPLRTVTITIP